MEIDQTLPGAELVTKGLRDIDRCAESPEALLVAMAAPRLRLVGIDPAIESGGEPAGHRLYALLAADDEPSAHSRYNALVGRMVSFARAAEHAQAG